MEGPLIASKVKRRNSRLLGLRESVFLKLEMLPHPPNSNSCVTVVSTVELDNFYHGIYTSHLRYNKIDGIYWCNFRAKNVLKCVNLVSIQFSSCTKHRRIFIGKRLSHGTVSHVGQWLFRWLDGRFRWDLEVAGGWGPGVFPRLGWSWFLGKSLVFSPWKTTSNLVFISNVTH